MRKVIEVLPIHKLKCQVEQGNGEARKILYKVLAVLKITIRFSFQLKSQIIVLTDIKGNFVIMFPRMGVFLKPQ